MKKNFNLAIYTFLHQRVYDPIQKTLVHLNPLPDELQDKELQFLGPNMSIELAVSIAEGNIDPITFERFIDNQFVNKKIISTNKASYSKKYLQPLPVQKNLISAYLMPISVEVARPFVPPRPKARLWSDVETSSQELEQKPVTKKIKIEINNNGADGDNNNDDKSKDKQISTTVASTCIDTTSASNSNNKNKNSVDQIKLTNTNSCIIISKYFKQSKPVEQIQKIPIEPEKKSN